LSQQASIFEDYLAKILAVETAPVQLVEEFVDNNLTI